MFGFYTEIFLFSTSDDYSISDYDYSTFKVFAKKKMSVAEQLKHEHFKKRTNFTKKHSDRVKDDFKMLENYLKSNILIRCFWKSSDHVILVFENGFLVNLIIDLETGQMQNIIFDKFLLKHLHNDHLIDVLFLENHLVCICANNQVTLFHLTRNSLSTFLDYKLKKLEPIVKNVQLSCLTNRRLEKQIIANEFGTLVLIWWRNSRSDIHPWSPNVRDEDRANIYLYNLSGTRLDLYGYYCSEFDIVYVQFSKKIENIIFCIEQRSDMQIDLSVLKFQTNSKMEKLFGITLEVDGEISALAFSHDEDKLLLATSKSVLLIYDRLSGKVTTTKSLFVPVLISWHYSSTFFSIFGETGEIQCFDLALANIPIKNVQNDESSVLDLRKIFKQATFLLDASWNKKITKATTIKYKYRLNNSYLLLNFEKGPLVIVKFVGLVNYVEECFTADVLVGNYLNQMQLDRAIKMFVNMNWLSNGVSCLAALQKIFNFLMRKEPTSKIADQFEKVLSTFESSNLNEETKLNFSAQLQDLNRRYFHYLLRSDNSSRAFKIANQLNHHDLFMDLYYHLESQANFDLASTAKTKALEILNAKKMYKIYGKRDTNGICEFLVNIETNLWLAKDEINAQAIEDYENEQKKLKGLERKALSMSDKLEFGFERRVEPEKILGVVTSDGKKYALVKWQHMKVADMLLYDVVEDKYPQLVLRFLETVMRNNNRPNSSENDLNQFPFNDNSSVSKRTR